MRAFSKGITKQEILTEMYKHKAADAFIKNTYGETDESGKFFGCAVGCSLKSIGQIKGIDIDTSRHVLYEKYVDVPEWLARLQDRIFEGLPDKERTEWPTRFWEAINEGSDLNEIKTPFLIYIVKEALAAAKTAKYDEAENPQVKEAFEKVEVASNKVIEALESGDEHKLKAARAAAHAAYAAADAAAHAAAYAAADAAYAAAKAAAYVKHSEKLLELMKGCE